MLRQHSTISTKTLRAITFLPNELRQILIGQLLSDAYLYRSSNTSNTRIEHKNKLRFYLICL